MPLNKGKHKVAELEGVRCTVVEAGIPEKRVEFLKELLEYNGYEVKVQEDVSEEEGAEKTFTIGVTDLVFNPVIAVYEKKLMTKEGNRVSPAYWNQWDEPKDIPYWLLRKP